MYWHQLIQYHRGLSGAPEHEVIKSLEQAQGISYQEAARQVEMAAMMKYIRRVKCDC